MSFTEKDMRFWIEHKYNVLMCGERGTGKTARITELFSEYFGEIGKDWLYFSCATLDPWVDFVGVPKEHNDGTVSYLDLVRPKHFAYDNVKAIFCDEYNRASSKVLNATLELIQFKSVNGKKFNNLQLVWAAINPKTEDDEYTVEALDPAHKDRFHIYVDVPSFPDKKFFINKYGENGAVAIEWWNKLDEKMKKLVSPRRLDYALDVFNKNGEIKYVLAQETNPAKLSQMLMSGSIEARLAQLYNARDISGAEAFLRVENNYHHVLDSILKNKDYLHFFLPLISDENITSIINNKYHVLLHVLVEGTVNQKYKNIIKSILSANDKSAIAISINKAINADKKLIDAYKSDEVIDVTKWGSNSDQPVISFKAHAVGQPFDVAKTDQIIKEGDPLNRWRLFFELNNAINSPASTGINQQVRLSIDDAKKSLTCLEHLLRHTQYGTIEKHQTAVVKFLNYAIYSLFAGEKVNLIALSNNYPTLCRIIGNTTYIKENIVKHDTFIG